MEKERKKGKGKRKKKKEKLTLCQIVNNKQTSQRSNVLLHFHKSIDRFK